MSTTQPQDTIKASDLKLCLETAMETRVRQYQKVIPFAVRWEADQTKAERDTKNFNMILRSLGFPSAIEYIIPAGDKVPGWGLRRKFMDMVGEGLTCDGRSLVMVHYAGHGRESPSGELLLCGPGNKNIQASFALFSSVDDKAQIDGVDVIFILDCCWSHLATRSVDNRERVTEVVAATSFQDPTANIPGSKVSLTARLSAAIAKAVGQKHEHIEFAELVRDLRAEDTPKKPTYGLLAGTSSIRLKLPGSYAPFSLPGPATLRAYFSIHVHPSMGQIGLDSLAEWINRLPPYFIFEIDKIFETESQCWLVYADWALYSKLAGLPGIAFICETKGVDVWHNRHKANQGKKQVQKEVPKKEDTRKENVKPSTGA
ncbi:hypothetical protein BDV38DRAFT_282349 [Aspergillus pseudotamarii]|uniref:Peptidase C14 caspase domain-containing protein n=1 Tax=Aspergillus pseudotamarii TaxID=132259 RepID=A0A5N6SWC8_ASPPS|nr:uncharacterized protein BDV38DRAFT_282349 [Aspergillus pseudotamarii]KAE8138040.1 hypothetical protein BDV38DRAFT_282349 [Aspergillus pseudotamarii]